MQTVAIYFHPKGTLASPLKSDTLFGAVCWGIEVLKLLPDLSGWLSEHRDAPPFAFSEAFPIWFGSGSDHLRFYPRPALFEVSVDDIDALVRTLSEMSPKAAHLELTNQQKQLRRVRFLSEGIFQDIVGAKLRAQDVLIDLIKKGGNYQIHGGALLSGADLKSARRLHRDELIETSVEYPIQHNHIDRMAGGTVESLLFYQSETFFAEKVGLWALVRGENTVLSELVLPALRYLADTGFGANRTLGKGHFDIEAFITWTELPVPDKPNAVLMLSRYLPAEDEKIDPQRGPMAYKLINLRPKREQKFPRSDKSSVTPAVYKQPVRMFEPGAILPLMNYRPICGRLALVVPASEGWPVYQSGAAIPLPVRM